MDVYSSPQNISQRKNENINHLNNFIFLNDLTKDSYTHSTLDNTFIVIKSINNWLLLIYTNKNKSILSYNLINNQIITEIKNAHDYYIINFRYYLDSINKRDLIISISLENNLKLWNNQNWNCLLNIKNIYNEGNIYSACFINDNNIIYILTSNCNWNFENCELIKIYDFNGNKIKEINNSNENTFIIDSYYDIKSNKNYIISGNIGYCKSYDFKNNKL